MRGCTQLLSVNQTDFGLNRESGSIGLLVSALSNPHPGMSATHVPLRKFLFIGRTYA